MVGKIPNKLLPRRHEIIAEYMQVLDSHLDDIVAGRTLNMYEIRDIAEVMHIHPTHLTNTIKETTGKSPCYFFEEKILDIVKAMLRETNMPVAEIAVRLTYDPSNFTKFFKRFEGITPKQYREQFYEFAQPQYLAEA